MELMPLCPMELSGARLRPLGGYCGTIGHLLAETDLTTPEAQSKRDMPIWMYNGTDDNTMQQWSFVEPANQRLCAEGFTKFKQFKFDGIDHSTKDDEGVWIIDFLSKNVHYC